MKKHNYFFARLFVTMAVALAVLLVLVGGGLAAFRLQAMHAQQLASAYSPDPTLLTSVKRLNLSYDGTRRRVLRSLNLDSFPSEVPIVDLQQQIFQLSNKKVLELPSSYSSIASSVSSSVASIKQYHFSTFKASIKVLNDALRAHANLLRQQYKDPTPPQNATPTAATKPTASFQPTVFRIYADPSSSDSDRLETINGMKTILEVLREQSQKAESLAAISQATVYLERAQSLLDFLKAERNTAPQDSTTQQPSAHELVARADLIANRLERAANELEQTLFSRWVVDADIENLEIAAAKDQKLAEQSVIEQRQIFIAAIRDCFAFIFSACFAAFLIVVVADIIRAFLNLSNNSDIMAFAYESAMPQETVQPDEAQAAE